MGLYRIIVNIEHPAAVGPSMNVWHYRTNLSPTADPPDADLENAFAPLQAFYTAWQADAAGGTVFTCSGTATRVTDDLEVSTDEGWGFTVSSTDPAMGSQTAFVIGWRTSVGGRRGRGRTFCGPLATGATSANGTPSATALGHFADAGDVIVDHNVAELGNGAFVVFSRLDNVGRDITAHRERDVFAVIRGRRQ